MSKRSRPQPITAPAPESFLPSFDFDARPKSRAAAPPPKVKSVPLAKRLAAFTFVNLEDIAEEGNDPVRSAHSPDPLSPPPTTSSSKASRLLGFARGKSTTPTIPTPLPPMSSKAYATLVGGPNTPGSASSSRAMFSPPPSKVIRSAFSPSMAIEFDAPIPSSKKSRTSIKSSDSNKDDQKSLAVDLVSIFSVSTNEETDYNTRFSFPMPPSFTPRRGSQSPLDPDLSFTSTQSPISPLSPDSVGSAGSDGSFFSPLFTPGFVIPRFPSDTYVAPDEVPPVVPLKLKTKETTEAEKRRSLRPILTLVPPAMPPPRISPPATPSDVNGSPTSSMRMDDMATAARRACPSPDLDPELSASSIASALLGGSASSSSSADEKSDAEEDNDKLHIFGDWNIGAPSRSGSIVTITQRAINAAVRRGSLSTIGATTPSARQASFGSDTLYDNWEQAIDDIYSMGMNSRKPSLVAINMNRRPSLGAMAAAAAAPGAASANMSLDVVEDTAFVMDEEMLRKLTESQFLVASRNAPSPPSPSSSRAPSSLASRSTASLASTLSASADATPSASNTSSTRSSLDDDSSSVYGTALEGPLTPIVEDSSYLAKPTKTRPAPIIHSQGYPPVGAHRPIRIADTNVGSVIPLPPRPRRIHAITPEAERPPPTQSVPDESAFFSPVFSPSSNTFSQPANIDSWPTWSTIDVAMAGKLNGRKPSVGAMSKFSDDSVDVGKPRRRYAGNRLKAAHPEPIAENEVVGARRARKNGLTVKQNTSPGSSYTSYTFLGLKKKSSPTSTTPPVSFTPNVTAPKGSPKESRARTSSESESSSDGGKRNGLKRPPLPLELFIRA